MTVMSLVQGVFLSYGKYYEVIDRSGNSFKVINDLGNYQWYDKSYFQW